MDALTICTLPTHGTSRNGLPGGGSEARFGPEGSGFANRFFSVTIFNDTIYQTTASGACTPFVTFPNGSPWTLAFTADGSRMLVNVRAGGQGGAGGPNARSQILAVAPDGTIDPNPVYVHPDAFMFDIAVAPQDFGAYAGQIFFTHRGPSDSRGPYARRPHHPSGARHESLDRLGRTSDRRRRVRERPPVRDPSLDLYVVVVAESPSMVCASTLHLASLRTVARMIAGMLRRSHETARPMVDRRS
ncbi:MAG: hypothetical protein ABL971_07545 [Vicinamibacterales bacterium]